MLHTSKAIINPTPPRAPLPINIGFGDSPIGKKQAKRLGRPIPPQKRRTLANRIGHAFSEFRQKFFKAADPQSPRAAAECRHALKQTSARTGELLGQLIYQPALSPEALAKSLQEIKSAAKPLWVYEKFSTVLAKRFEVHLHKLTPQELKTLRTQLTVMQSQVSDAKVAKHLNGLDKALKRELERRVFATCRKTLLPELRQAIGLATEHPELAASAFDGLRGKTIEIMDRYGLNRGVKNQAESQLARRVMGTVINGLLEQGLVQAEDFTRLVRALPSHEQVLLKNAPNPHLSPRETPTLDSIVSDFAKAQRDRLSMGFHDAADDLEQAMQHAQEHGTTLGASGLRNLIGFASQCKALQNHVEAHGMNEDTRVAQRLESLLSQLDSMNIVSADLTSLQHDELNALSKALTFLRHQNGLDAVKAAIDARLNKGVEDCRDAMLLVLNALDQGDVRSALVQLRAVHTEEARLMRIWEQLSGRSESDRDDLRRLQHQTFALLLDGLDAQTRQRFTQYLGGEGYQRLIETLKSLSSELQLTPAGPQSESRAAIGVELNAIGDSLMQLLASATVLRAPEQAPDADSQIDPKRQDTSVSGLVYEVFQIPLRPVNNEAQQEFETQLQPIRDDLPQSFYEPSGGGFHTGVPEPTWKDFGRATHTFMDAGGRISMHMEPAQFPREEGDRLRVRQQMLDGLFALAGHEPNSAERLARCLNQRGIPATFQFVQSSAASPLRLPDGRAGSVTLYRSETGETYARTRYTARPGQAPGQFLVHVEYSMDRVGRFTDVATGDSVDLDPEQSYARFSADIVIEADGRIHAPEAFSVDYHLVEAKPAQPAA